MNKQPKGALKTSGDGQVVDDQVYSSIRCCSVCKATYSDTTWARGKIEGGACRCYSYTGTGEIDISAIVLVILNFLDGASKLEDSVKDGGVFKYSTSECGSATKRRKRFDEFLATNNETESQREMSKMKIKRQVEVQQESSETRTSTTTTTVCKATSGPASGSECVFPFNYKGVSYTGCTLFEDTKPWCSTQTDANNNHVSGVDAWGYCDATCPKQGCQK